MSRVQPQFPSLVDPQGVNCSNIPRDIGQTTDSTRLQTAYSTDGSPKVDFAGTSNPYVDYQFIDLLHTLQAPRSSAHDETCFIVHGSLSHHPLMAFVADWRLVASFWLRPGDAHSANNAQSFIEQTIANLGSTKIGFFRADSGFYDQRIVTLLRDKEINHIISTRLSQGLQQAIVDQCVWQDIETGLQVSELEYTPKDWVKAQGIVVVRQHVKRKAAAGTTLASPALCSKTSGLPRRRWGGGYAVIQLDECISPSGDA